MLSEALRRRQAEWEALLEEARAYAHRVREALGEARVYPFGSVARGEFNEDLDLLVVSPHLPQDPLERLALLHRLRGGRVEPQGLLPEEFARLEAEGALWWPEGAEEL